MSHLIWHLMHIFQSLAINQQECARKKSSWNSFHQQYENASKKLIDISINICPKRSHVTFEKNHKFPHGISFSLPYNWSP